MNQKINESIMRVKLVLFSAVAVFFLSCSVPRDVVYFQDFDAYMKTAGPEVVRSYDPVIKNNDQLMITVSSPVLMMDQTQVAQFNLPVNLYLTPGETTSTQPQSIQTYLVDTDGFINFPVVGKIRLAGLTRSQAIAEVAQKVSAFLSDPIINFQMISYKVTVLGEVLKPGPVEVKDGRVSILDALGAAGDMTIYGDRRNVLLIRDTNGRLEHHKLDLTTSDVFNSPYYYLQQNDVVYVTPNDTRKFDSHFGQADSYRMSVISLVLSTLSVLTSTAVTIIALTKSK
jgi:polysaccharide export outer membrane protein